MICLNAYICYKPISATRSHPNKVAMYFNGSTQKGGQYLVMNRILFFVRPAWWHTHQHPTMMIHMPAHMPKYFLSLTTTLWRISLIHWNFQVFYSCRSDVKLWKIYRSSLRYNNNPARGGQQVLSILGDI